MTSETSEDIMMRYGQRLALQEAAKEAARPRPIILPDLVAEFIRTHGVTRCPPSKRRSRRGARRTRRPPRSRS
jgi:hypothetical protein